MEECMRDRDIRREWTEAELVISAGGGHIMGTPDGMFEEHSGELTCVQVVRVPVRADMTQQDAEDALYAMVLQKVYKSQHWMKATHILPTNFIIFCWVPPLASGTWDRCGDRVDALMEKLRAEGWPFYVKLMEPTAPGDLFPARFACKSAAQAGRSSDLLRKRTSTISEADLSTFDQSFFESDEDEEPWRCDVFAIPEAEEDSTNSGSADEAEESSSSDGHVKSICPEQLGACMAKAEPVEPVPTRPRNFCRLAVDPAPEFQQ